MPTRTIIGNHIRYRCDVCGIAYVGALTARECERIHIQDAAIDEPVQDVDFSE